MRAVEQPLATPAPLPRLGRRPEGMLEATLVKSPEISKLLQKDTCVTELRELTAPPMVV